MERGDIVCFYFDETGEQLGKRVIGLPGDTIYFMDGNVYINDELYDESEYLDESVKTYSPLVFTVPENSYFVLGDSRKDSYDSRYWKAPYVSKENIIEKNWFRIHVNLKY